MLKLRKPNLHATDPRSACSWCQIPLAAAVCFLGTATAALLHTLPNINNCTTLCLPPPTPLFFTKHKQFCPSCCLFAQLAMYVLCPYRPKVWSGSARRTTRRGSPSCSLISKSITCPISSPTSPRRPVCTILFWVRVYDIPSCQSKHNFYIFIYKPAIIAQDDEMSNLDLCPVL